MTISFCTDLKLASPLLLRDAEDDDTDDDDALSGIPNRAELTGLVPECALRIHRRSRELGRPVATSTIHRAPQPGRNASCPCGSGKKYKMLWNRVTIAVRRLAVVRATGAAARP